MEEKIVTVLNEMSEYLSITQMKKLQEVIIKTFAENEATKVDIENEDFLNMFLAAKRIEGCSERTIDYYRVTVQHLLSCTEKSVRKITTEEMREYLSNYQKRNNCSNVTIDNVTINNPYDSPNTDGIDPESCSNIHISNCHVDVGDDCIAIKAGTEGTAERVPCKNITITNCTMVHGHGGVVIGSEMSGSVENVTISNCVFTNTDRGIRLKSRRYRGGAVQDIRVDNVIMENVLCPFIANLYYMWGPRGMDPDVVDKNPAPVTKDTPVFRRLHFSNMTCKDVNASAGHFFGLAEMYVEDCTFENVYISIADNAVEGEPAMYVGVQPVKEKGFVLTNTRGIKFNNVTVVGVNGPAFEVENSEDITFTNCINKNNKSNSEMVKQTNCKNVVVK